MPYNDAASDWEKLQLVWREMSQKMGSLHDILEAFGVADLPVAQRYGILFGCLVFVVTVTSVIVLLVAGGSFRRMAEQSEAGTTCITPSEARAQRPLLLESLLESRERLLRRYQPQKQSGSHSYTPLTRLLLQQAPDAPLEEDDYNNYKSNSTDENATPNQDHASSTNNNKINDNTSSKGERYIPPMYQEHYLEAYRTCQDKPGGSILSGRPEARYEAYARAYAGCGPPAVNRTYRRSYARRYETLCCRTHGTDDHYTRLARERPHDLIGQYIRLEALESERHLEAVFAVTSGQPALENTAYDPHEVWGFWEQGPFASPQELEQSFVFQQNNNKNEAGFAMVHAITEQVLGVILLRHDDPANLSVQLEPPILPPSRYGTSEQLEACFLLLDRLFAHGYRRIQMAIDAQDAEQRKLCRRLGMTMEGCLGKHRIVKEANRDSHIYSMLNSDWHAKDGARAALFAKLYGIKALRADWANAQKEEELDEQTRGLAEQKLQAELEQQQQQESKKKV